MRPISDLRAPPRPLLLCEAMETVFVDVMDMSDSWWISCNGVGIAWVADMGDMRLCVAAVVG